ncbi:MAG: hypothetical protein F4X51_02570 [Gemmatimonadetes bacterium]|nr:hypothetical protein [Gemmatimonadota bacterium]MYD63967.1 hypothetical protein [Gemmatimonadota bacterium]
MIQIAAIVLALSMCVPGTLLARVVFKAGEIDSSKVEIGAYAEVIYEKGERDPISGKWKKQAAVRGYIKAVDADILTVGRGFWKEQIAFERIQKLTIADSDHEMDQLGRRTGMHSGARGVLKLASGTVGGLVLASAGAGLGLINGDSCGNGESLCIDGEAALGAIIGYVLGVSAGVSAVDPHDQFISALGGTLIGGATGIVMTTSEEKLWPSILIGPVIGATIMSELTRKPPEARRFSVGLAPNSDGRLSAIATFRF